MSAGNRTPGPWRQGSSQLQSPELPTEIYAANGYLVARCHAGHSRGKQGLSEHRTAIDNAYLIAESLQLLELLSRYVHQDETAADTENNLYRSAKALVVKLGATP